MERRRAQAFALEVARHAASVANYCDHAEHNEPLDRDWVLGAGAGLRHLITALCAELRLALVDLYAERLAYIEARNVMASEASPDGRRAVEEARTWRDLQLIQAAHDRAYHLDVAGLARFEQLRHYALHLSKIVGAFASCEEPADLVTRRLPDALIFALKLSTVMGERLEETPLPRPPDDPPSRCC